MESATEKQVSTLKNFAKDLELNKSVLKGLEFEKLTKKEATELITKCYDHQKNRPKVQLPNIGGYQMRYTQNYKDFNGKFRTATLTDEELAAVREAHRQHCHQILSECKQDYPTEAGSQQCVFHKRCDKIYTWIQMAVAEKVRRERNALKPSFTSASDLMDEMED